MGMTLNELIKFYEMSGFNVHGSVVNTELLPTLRKWKAMEDVLEKIWNNPNGTPYDVVANMVMETYRTVR